MLEQTPPDPITEQINVDSELKGHLQDIQQQFNQALNTYFGQFYRETCYLGLMFEQGKRKMIQINVPAHDLPVLLQAKPSDNNDPDSGKNRPEVKGHTEEVKEYILKRVKHHKPWILGTLTANIDPNKIEILELGRGICFVVIPRGVKLDITDGQHRKRAIHQLIESSNGELIGDNDFPITLVLEPDFQQCQTDFRDMAQTRALDKSLLISFGEFEGSVGITKKILETVPMFNGKTEKIKGTPSPKHKHIYTVNFLDKMVSSAFANDPSDPLENINVDEASRALSHCLNLFFSECQQTKLISSVSAYDLTVKQVENFQNTCVLGRSVGVEILGRLFYCTYDAEIITFDHFKVSQLAQLDWSAGSELWRDNVVKIDPNPRNPEKIYRFIATMSSIRIAVIQAKRQLGWLNQNTDNAPQLI